MEGFARAIAHQTIEEDNEKEKEKAREKEGEERDGKEPLTAGKLALCLALYADALLIVQSVHSAHILHFDIKCNNFILRCEPDLEAMYRAHERGEPSGYMFLADFGESVPIVVNYSARAQTQAESVIRSRNYSRSFSMDSASACSRSNSMKSTASERYIVEGGPSTKSRSRGTLPTQSPEMLCLSASQPNDSPTRSSNHSPRLNPDPIDPTLSSSHAIELQVQAMGQIHDQDQSHGHRHEPTRKMFQPPSAPSDVWSLGLMLVELITGEFLTANRPWIDLYVSFCMKKFLPPSLAGFRKSIAQATSQPEVCVLLDGIVKKCVRQDPGLRAKIIDIFEDVMTIVVALGVQRPVTPIGFNSNSMSESNTTLSQKSVPNLNLRNTSSVFLSIKTVGSQSQPPSRWSLNRTFNVVQWSKETARLRPRSLDFRCGSGLVITLLSKDDIPTIEAEVDISVSLEHSSKCSKFPLSTADTYLYNAQYPCVPIKCLRKGGDSALELRGRIEAASDLIDSVSLASCAKSLAQRSVINSIRDEGVFHIEISSSLNANPDTENSKNDYFRGIERLVLPIRKSNEVSTRNLIFTLSVAKLSAY
jgi:serine/threonine protein kinase